MRKLNSFYDLERVAAPPDFEQKVLAELPTRRKQLLHLRRTRRLVFAGAAFVTLATFLLVNALILQKSQTVSSAKFDMRPASAQAELIPVMETLDYSSEVHNASYEPQTIYILEQVSEASASEITY